jgi:hypothetical protein
MEAAKAQNWAVESQGKKKHKLQVFIPYRITDSLFSANFLKFVVNYGAMIQHITQISI